MATIAPRHPVLGIVRLVALFWTLLSLLGFGLGMLAVLYAGAWGCFGHANGWFGCTVAYAVLPLAAAGSLFTAGVVLFFSHLFYVAGAKSEEYRSRKRTWRERGVGVVLEVITDILD